MVIIMDRLSDLIAKGEIIDRYYNPGNLFDEVDIVLMNNDVVDPSSVQRTVGNAKLHLHSIRTGPGLFFRSLGWRPWLLKSITDQALALAEKIKPDVIRTHGNHLNAFVANRIKEKFGIPHLLSMHTVPDEDTRRNARSLKPLLLSYASIALEKSSIKDATLILPVYTGIIPYLKEYGAREEQIEICYNVINPEHLQVKTDYGLHGNPRLISVGRQFKEKDCSKIIEAVSRIDGVEYHLYGDGEYHERHVELARRLGIEERVFFFKSAPNDELCRLLPTFDLFVTHIEFFGISKTTLEALLTGLPVIINRRTRRNVEELEGGIVTLVDHDVESYREAISKMIGDESLRRKQGEFGRKRALEKWAPEKTEARYVEIYRRFV